MGTTRETLHGAFPSTLSKDVDCLLRKVVLLNTSEPIGEISVVINKEAVKIPYRIYSKPIIIWPLTNIEKTILRCWLTRHHDGYIRMDNLAKLLHDTPEWAIPFIFQLLGEYVIEITTMTKEALTPELLNKLKQFVLQNPEYAEKTRQRMISYWDCLHRKAYRRYQDYPGVQILDRIKR